MITESGHIFAQGRNNRRQCISDHCDEKIGDLPCVYTHDVTSSFGRDQEIISIVCLESGSLFLNNYGEVFVCGIHGSEEALRKLPIPSQIIKIESGVDHFLCMDSESCLWSMGLNFYGQCCFEQDRNVIRVPTRVSHCEMKEIADIRCGRYYSLILRSDGTVFAFGAGLHGQMGNGETNRENYGPL